MFPGASSARRPGRPPLHHHPRRTPRAPRRPPAAPAAARHRPGCAHALASLLVDQPAYADLVDAPDPRRWPSPERRGRRAVTSGASPPRACRSLDRGPRRCHQKNSLVLADSGSPASASRPRRRPPGARRLGALAKAVVWARTELACSSGPRAIIVELPARCRPRRVVPTPEPAPAQSSANAVPGRSRRCRRQATGALADERTPPAQQLPDSTVTSHSRNQACCRASISPPRLAAVGARLDHRAVPERRRSPSPGAGAGARTSSTALGLA